MSKTHPTSARKSQPSAARKKPLVRKARRPAHPPARPAALEQGWTARLAAARLVAKKLLSLAGPRLGADTLDNVDPEMVSLALPAVRLLEKYFRAEVKGIENMPEGPALVVGNHNAGITFFEPFFLALAWFRHDGGREQLRFLGHDAMVALPLVGNMLVKVGVIRAGQATASLALSSGSKVVVFPGGNYEAFRPFSQRFIVDFGGKTGFAKLALRHGVPIVPVLSVGGHETFFVLWRGALLARLTGVRKYLRSESFPLFLGLPWGLGVGPIFHLPLPAKMLVEVGEPMTWPELGPEDAEMPEVLEQVSREVQARLQEMMDRRKVERRWPVLG